MPTTDTNGLHSDPAALAMAMKDRSKKRAASAEPDGASAVKAQELEQAELP